MRIIITSCGGRLFPVIQYNQFVGQIGNLSYGRFTVSGCQKIRQDLYYRRFTNRVIIVRKDLLWRYPLDNLPQISLSLTIANGRSP
jgi:hypothetical protein